FFSSRRRHTRFSRDWSSDVCSSDLALVEHAGGGGVALGRVGEAAEVRRVGQVDRLDLDVGVHGLGTGAVAGLELADQLGVDTTRSEERRVGKECRSRWRAYQ